MGKQKWHRGYRCAGVIILVLGLCSSVSGGDTLELARRHASSIGGQVVQIEGVSMEPRLSENDLVVVVPVMWVELKHGDMVQFSVSEKIQVERGSLPTWIHQVSLKEGNWIRTVGINNPELDPFWIHKRDVVGKVVAVYLGGGKDAQTISEKALSYFQSNTSSGSAAKD